MNKLIVAQVVSRQGCAYLCTGIGKTFLPIIKCRHETDIINSDGRCQTQEKPLVGEMGSYGAVLFGETSAGKMLYGI